MERYSGYLKIILIGVIAFGYLLFFAPWNKGMITCTGSSKLDQAPQIATFYATVTVSDDDKQKAVDLVNQKMTELLASLKSFGIPEAEPLEHKLISKSLESAQGKIEGYNFDARKHLLEYVDILNKQRLLIYEKRQKLLVEKITPQLISMLDLLWMNHLENMEALRESVRLRAYGQHDPLIEYRRESHILFKQLLEDFDKWLEENSEKLKAISDTNSKMVNETSRIENKKPLSMSPSTFNKVGRNDPCPCRSGKKYKKCHGK